MEELKFCTKTQTLQSEDAWQEDMYQTLVKCRRLVKVLKFIVRFKCDYI